MLIRHILKEVLNTLLNYMNNNKLVYHFELGLNELF